MSGVGRALLAVTASLVVVGGAVLLAIRLGAPEPVVLLAALLILVSIARRL